MVNNIYPALLFLALSILVSCGYQSDAKFSLKSESKESPLFAKGELVLNDHFEGAAYLEMLIYSDSINRNAVGSVTFEPGARTNWHSHPNGQIILAIGGEGYYQEKGLPKKILQKGDAVKCPSNIPHWHGASENTQFIQIAITSRVDGPTVWFEPVTDEQYHKKP